MRHGLYTMQLQRLLGSVLIVACVTSITACNLLEVPGRFPLVGPPPAPIVPEPAACVVALVPNALHAAPGSTVTVSVNMTVNDPCITMAAISTRILYDPNVFT